MEFTRFKFGLRIVGITIMLFAFVIVPEKYPWYYEMILFNIGLALLIASKWEKVKHKMWNW